MTVAVSRPHDLEALRSAYAAADRALAGWTCDASTECCRFDLTGREPYLWPNEWALLERAIAARGVRKGKRSLAVVRDARGTCPLLGDDDRCTVYASRPFGCRTFFCHRAAGPTRRPPRDELAAIGRAVASLAQQADPECDGPRALTKLLAER